jgi:hypothetical protein
MSSNHNQLGILPGVDYCQVTSCVCVCVCVCCGRGESREGAHVQLQRTTTNYE